MLIYIIHPDKIYDFRLSSDVSGKYILTDYDQFGVKRNLVNIEAKDGQWYIFQNRNVRIKYNGEKYDSINLKLYTFYTLQILGKETVLIYTMPIYDDTFEMYEVREDTEFIVGNSETSDIKFKCGVNKDLIKISYKNNQYKFESLNNEISLFVNKQRSKKGYLSNFDTIFVLGLKLTFMNNKFIVNKPNNGTLKFNPEKFTTVTDSFITKNYPTDVRTFDDFYEEGDYYFKSPVFKSQIKEAHVEIVDAPKKEEKDRSSVLMSVIPSFIMTISSVVTAFYTLSKYKRGETNTEDLITSLIMSIGFVFVGILWPFVERLVSNLSTNFRNKKAIKLYNDYLDQKQKELEEINREQKMSLTTNNLSYSDCVRVIESRTSELFSRNLDSEDFLNVCLGIGNIALKGEISFPEPSYTEENNELVIKVEEMIKKNKIIEQAPFVVSLKEKNVLAFILENRELFKEYMQGIILQLLTLHSYYDLKLVVLTSSENSEISYLKDSNSCWSDDHSFRYFATNLEEAQQISTNLERELNLRKVKKDDSKMDGPYYLIISDSIYLYRNLNIINDIIHSETNLNFGLLMYDLRIGNIPSDCMNFINISRKEGIVFKTNVSSNELDRFTPSFVVDANVDVDKYSRLISNIPIKRVENKMTSIPNAFGFLQMYNVGNVEQLNVLSKWDTSNPSNSLAVPLGIDGNQNLIYLDLHEKNHGPHGLIAGMTGSGKSELIITYILSLAVNFRPDEVQFVLIDYKGGGLAGAFENRSAHIKLPHLVGTITNLDKSEMKRTLVSINSELQRRQRQFNVVKESLNIGGIDIYKYQKLHRDGVIKEPMSHLFIICDEFAELKAQQPDFMDELVSAARIGRSLGIHLILATQKPSGVVDDQIWSNAKFKICCRVQTEDDSQEMIKKPDAARLKGAGSFYLQVGLDEYFVQGQAAYAGFPYIPTDRISTQIDNDITFIGNSGEPYKTIVSDDTKVVSDRDLGEEFTNVLKYIINVSENNNYGYNQLWLDNVPPVLYYNQLVNKYNAKAKYFDISPVIGEYDDPKNQKQGIVNLKLTTGGNTFICGASGSGKNTLLSTIIYSTIINHNCSEVNIYIIDLGTEKLRKYQSAPQVGDVLTINDSDKIKYLFYSLESEKKKRQKYYSTKSTDFITDAMAGNAPFPNILVIIYDIDVFKEAFEDFYDDVVAQFVRNCSKYGINFIVTGTVTNSLGFMVENSFHQKIMLNMTDPSDYMTYFDNPPIPNPNPGRGIIALDDNYEFQVSLVFDEAKEEENLNYILKQLNNFLKNPAPTVPTIPDEVTIESMSSHVSDITSLPVGINISTAQIGYYNFDKQITVMASESLRPSFAFLSGIINLMKDVENTSIIVLKGLQNGNLNIDESVKVYEGGFKKVMSVLSNNVDKYNELNDPTKKFMIFVLGYTKIEEYLNDSDDDEEEACTIEALIKNSTNENFRFVLFDSLSALEEIKEEDLLSNVDLSNGIWIGPGYQDQEFFEAEDKYGNDNIRETKNTGAIVKNGKTQYIKYVK